MQPFAAAVKSRQDIFSGTPVIASTIVQIQRLAFPELMIEIRCAAKDIVLNLNQLGELALVYLETNLKRGLFSQ